jgi:hypothetical protein
VITIFLLVYDLCAINMAYFMALWLRFDLRFTMIPDRYLQAFLHFAPI